LNRKQKGNRREYKTRDWFIFEGYRVTRAGGSFGEFDLICSGLDFIYYVQVKSNSWCSAKEYQAIREFPSPPTGNVKLVIRWNDKQRLPEIQIVTQTTLVPQRPEYLFRKRFNVTSE